MQESTIQVSLSPLLAPVSSEFSKPGILGNAGVRMLHYGSVISRMALPTLRRKRVKEEVRK
jgi:hypothetical protein